MDIYTIGIVIIKLFFIVTFFISFIFGLICFMKFPKTIINKILKTNATIKNKKSYLNFTGFVNMIYSTISMSTYILIDMISKDKIVYLSALAAILIALIGKYETRYETKYKIK